MARDSLSWLKPLSNGKFRDVALRYFHFNELIHKGQFKRALQYANTQLTNEGPTDKAVELMICTLRKLKQIEDRQAVKSKPKRVRGRKATKSKRKSKRGR